MRRLFLFALLIAAASNVRAQNFGEEIRNIFFDTIKTGDIRPTPVAVETMRYVGTQYITAADSQVMQSATLVVQRDVEFYADFDLILPDSFFMQLYEIKELNLLSWQRLGATYVVRLEAEFPGANLRIRWRLFDAISKNEIAKGNEEGNRYAWRELAHEVANELVRTLTGEQGIFRTQIAYVRKTRKGKEIFLSDYDGANEKQLTSLGTISISPSISPKRPELYFSSFRDGDAQLFRVDLTTLQIKKITSYPGMVIAPAVSPDGNKIACVMTRDGNSEIYVLDTDGRIIKRLTNHQAIESAPSWSPDGRWLCFTSDRTGNPQIYLMDADGFNVKRLTFEGKYNDSPIWSSRGDRITFVSRTAGGRFDLASIDTSGVEYRVLTDIGTNENPHFSPDGKHLVFSSSRLGGIDVYTADLSGRNSMRVTRTGDCSNPTWGPLR